MIKSVSQIFSKVSQKKRPITPLPLREHSIQSSLKTHRKHLYQEGIFMHEKPYKKEGNPQYV